jgi:hypothetical protein
MNRTGFGPFPAAWAFKNPPVPECDFLFRHWYAEIPAAMGHPLVMAGRGPLQ